MDSGNSGSLQSSSGGDEEYDSRPPNFFNPNFGNLSNHLSLFPNQDHTFFDPSQSFFQPNNLNTSLLNLDVPGSRPLRPDLDYTKPSGQSIPNAQLGPIQGGPVPSMHLRTNGGRSASPSDQAQATGRNPKKRTRASRRAPTTVLTTDTSNFRAMVQEFTGIPAPPFSGSPYTRRFDLFGSGLRSDTVGTSSLYPLRPSAQKVHQQLSPFLFSPSSNSPSSSSSSSSSSCSSSLMNNNTISTNTSTLIPVTTSNFNSSSINYQLLPSEPQNLLNLQNQMLSFQSLLPSSSSFNVPNSKSQLAFEEMGMGLNQNLNSHGNINQSSLDNCCNNNKLNPSSTSDFHHHQKGLENVPPRVEGTTVDSWICPSD
ncbi:VQ motif-containing protein [Euphorbia peplus]|nr:VQ motif-containing protein [Euphorbia peplus]